MKGRLEHEMILGALGRMRAKEQSPDEPALHSHSCELSARVDALEEAVRFLGAQFDQSLRYLKRRQPSRQGAEVERTGSEG